MAEESYNWAAFYETLCQLGPKMVVGAELIDIIQIEASETDTFWSESLEETLDTLWNEDPEKAVRETVKEWFTVVKEQVEAMLCPMSVLPEILGMSREEIEKATTRLRFRIREDIIRQLTAAALRSESSV